MNMNIEEKEIIQTIDELVKAKAFMESTDKRSKDVYIAEIDDILSSLKTREKILGSMCRAKNVLISIERFKWQ